VPAFSGLLAPRWRSDARGVILGISSYSTRAHIVRALLEAIAWQVRGAVLSLFFPRFL
jgi:glycerol kinase